MGNIKIDSIRGSDTLVKQVVEIIKQGEPYVEVMDGFDYPLKFKLYFQVGDYE